ncbi:MAG: ribbon-helix-helix protein, CopG family, partial [Candidatus Odinarchaeota archaeon]|nr:ribbon-helix-helix protein, CopG family [Candidatus Odinarchaeota archaeon]
VTPVRLSKNDLELIDYLIKRGEFKNRSEFIRFAIKLT